MSASGGEAPGAVEVTLEIPDHVLPLPERHTADGPDGPDVPEGAESEVEHPLSGGALPVRAAAGTASTDTTSASASAERSDPEALAPQADPAEWAERAEQAGPQSGTQDEAQDEAQSGPGPWRRLLALLGLMIAVAAAALEQTVLAAALPQLTAELDGADRTFWILVLPVAAACFGPLLFGWLGDRCGHTGAFGLALALFAAASAIAGWCGAMPELVAFRAVQGVAAGGVLAGARRIVADMAPDRTRGRQLGLLLLVFGLAAAGGPALGGRLVEAHDWRWCLWLAVGAGLLSMPLSACAVDRGVRVRGPRTRRAFRAALPRPRALLVCVALSVAVVGVADALPHYLWLAEAEGGAGAARAGLLLLPLLGGVLLAALLAGELISRTGHFRTFPVLGCAMGIEGMWLVSQVEADTSEAVFCVWTGILGLGLGFGLPVLIRVAGGGHGAAYDGTHHGAYGDTYRDAYGDSYGRAYGDSYGDSYGRAYEDWTRRAAGGLGVALVAVLLVHRLAVALAPGTDGLPDVLRDMYERTYADAMPRAFLSLLPMLLLGLLLALFLKENSLVTQHISVPQARTAEGAATASGASAPGPAGAAGVPVCGSIRHHDGSTVPHAALTLVDTAGRQVGRGATGEDGRYALSTPGGGAYVMIASAGGHQPRAVSVTVGERPVELDVVLGGAGRLAGGVLTADGQPVKDAAVTLTDVRGEVVATTRSGREGAYVIEDLVAGEYTLAASAPVYRPAALPVSVQASRETRQDIELAGGAVLRGTVRAGGGRPVEDARVTLLDAAGNVVDTVTTGADGTFRFVDLSSGEYTVVAAGYPPVATVLQIAGGGRTERDLQLGHED